MPWFKGNVHCHSTNSDGHSSPAEVARYYRAMGMDFVTVSDHNRLTSITEYASELDDRFVGIPCCEYTGRHNCHVVAVDVDEAVKPEPGVADADPLAVLQDGIDRTLAAGGVPVLCHPCWNWAFDHETILKLRNATHFEVFNASPDCNSHPLGDRSYPERIWDEVLSAGRRLYGVATDDAHFHGSAEEAARSPKHLAVGGLGWSAVRADELSRRAVRLAFDRGDFYASTGVSLADYRVSRGSIEIEIDPWSHERVVTEFIGTGGTVLAREEGLRAAYRFRGDERYVRARIVDSTGGHAFTQPCFLDDLA